MNASAFRRSLWIFTGALALAAAASLSAANAKKVCARCPVTGADGPCADYARRTQSVGVWGGQVFQMKHHGTLAKGNVQDGRPVKVGEPRRRTGTASVPEPIGLIAARKETK